MSDNFKTYVVEYPFGGARWGATIKAESFDDAKRRIEHMGAFGTISGEHIATIPGPVGPLVRIAVSIRNLFRSRP